MNGDKKQLDFESLFSMDGLKIIDYKEELQENGKALVTFFTELNGRPSRVCPACDSRNVYSHGYGERVVSDLPMFGKDVKVVFRYQRYKCNECNTLYQDNIDSFAVSGSTMSNRLKEAIARSGSKFGFTHAANEYGGSVTNAKILFNEWADHQELTRGTIKAPKVLGIDEAHLGTSARDMRGVFVDAEKGYLLEIAKNRSSQTIQDTIKSFEDWKNIEAITIDMFPQYRKDIYDLFGQDILLVVDRFHVIQDLNKKMIKARKLIVKKAGNPKLGDNFNLMKINLENLNDVQKEHLMKQFAIVPELGILYALKESFRTIYNCKTKEEALQRYEDWCNSIPEKDKAPENDKKKSENDDSDEGRYTDRFEPIRKFKKTVDQWEKEIFNWFDMRVTNASTEAINGLIKRVNSDGRGYEFDTLRHKLLFGLQAASVPTQTVYINKRHPKAKPVMKDYLSPDVIDVNWYPRVEIKPLEYEDRVVSVSKFEEALNSGLIYIGEQDIPKEDDDD